MLGEGAVALAGTGHHPKVEVWCGVGKPIDRSNDGMVMSCHSQSDTLLIQGRGLITYYIQN
ncbi:hypothetical protein HanIR_Chr10g0502491 [Helianthus annuus]|nr:hypothetical protein HanIR_Chr10g0502491 [Helianthus annuus]